MPEGASPLAAIDIENILENEFRTRAHIHLPESHLPSTNASIDWWILMQHYGAPTRLLDWTESIFVAAYFAVERDWDVDGAIWLFDVRGLESSLRTRTHSDSAVAHLRLPNDRAKDPETRAEVLPWVSMRKTERIVAQQGHFTVSTNVLGNQEALLDSALHPEQASSVDNTIYMKLIIPASIKPKFLRSLRALNVTAHSLFPGVDGLGRAVSELARLGCAFPLPHHGRPRAEQT